MFRLPDIFAPTIRDGQERYNRVYEPVIAKVVDNVDPLMLARVKVTYPTLPGDDESHWATLSMLGAGLQRGWFFLPEIDDEVLVLFEQGDIRRPVVIGALWNGVDTPPDQNDGDNERRVIVSRSDSRIIFDDTEMTITFKDGGGVASVTFLANENHILVESTKDICLHVPDGDFEAVADTITINAGEKLKIHSTMPMKIGADEIEVSGDTKITIIGLPVNWNVGNAQMPQGTEASPEEVPDPLGTSGGGGAGGAGGGAGGGGGSLGGGGGGGGFGGGHATPLGGGPPPTTSEIASGHVGSSEATPAAIGSATEGQAPTQRHLGGFMQRGINAAVRGVVNGTFGGSLPGLPMPGTTDSGSNLPVGTPPFVPTGSGGPAVATPPSADSAAPEQHGAQPAIRNIVSASAQAAVNSSIDSAISGGNVGRDVRNSVGKAGSRAALDEVGSAIFGRRDDRRGGASDTGDATESARDVADDIDDLE